MMTLHVFNPEHDLALASGLANFTAPHAGRQLRHDLGFLPALWAKPGDLVLTDDAALAARSWQHVSLRLKALPGHEAPTGAKAQPLFVSQRTLLQALTVNAVSAWGWDAAICRELQRRGVSSKLLPDAERLDAIRRLSHREQAARLLPQLRTEGTVGQSAVCHSTEEVAQAVSQFGQRVVMKAPWSSSGRGLRFCDQTVLSDAPQLRENLERWTEHVLERQGAVIVEPCYNKVKDFGMEFESDGKGQATYQGLSLFHTQNGAYTGNLLATEATKRQMLSRYLPLQLVDDVQQRLCRLLGELCNGVYAGPLGVDMMVVNGGCNNNVNDIVNVSNGGGFLLHPCVEINLRRTMGHVALALQPTDDDVVQVMRIDYENQRYKLRITDGRKSSATEKN